MRARSKVGMFAYVFVGAHLGKSRRLLFGSRLTQSFSTYLEEFCMKKNLLALAAGAALLGTSFTALAVDIGGLDVPLGATFAVGQVYENVVTSVGDTLT